MGRGNNRPQVRATTLQRNNVLKIKMLKKQRLTTATQPWWRKTGRVLRRQLWRRVRSHWEKPDGYTRQIRLNLIDSWEPKESNRITSVTFGTNLDSSVEENLSWKKWHSFLASKNTLSFGIGIFFSYFSSLLVP